MGSPRRYDYMAHPNYNPPTDDCPECVVPSKTYFIGSRTSTAEDGARTKHTRYSCINKHTWTIDEPVLVPIR